MDLTASNIDAPSVSQTFRSEIGRRVHDANPEPIAELLRRDPLYRSLAQDPVTARFADLRRDELLVNKSAQRPAVPTSAVSYSAAIQTPAAPNPMQSTPATMTTPVGHSTYTASATGLPASYSPSAQEYDRLSLENRFHQEQTRAATTELQALQSRVQELERSNGHLRRECEERAKEIANLSAAKINAEKTAASMEVRLKTYETTATARTGEWEQAKASYQALLNKKSAEIRKLSDDLARLQEQGEVTSMREKELRDQTAAQSTNAQALALELENTRATLDQTVGKVEKLERGAADLRRQRKALQDDIKELEGLLGASEAERKELRARYVDLGEKMEMLLREEKATKEQSDRDILAVDVLAAEKAEIRDKAKQMKKAKVRLEQVCTELQSENAQLRQTLEDRSEKLSISEKRVQILVKKQQEHQQQFDAQLGVLKGQIEELEGALEKSRRRCEAVRKDVQKELEERADLELRQLEVKYERRVQELELEVRHLRTLDQNQQQSLFQQYVEAKLESIRLLEDPRVKDRTMDDHIERRVKAVLDECISKEEHAQKLTMARGEVTRDFSMRMDKVKADCDAKVSTITTEWRERLVESERKWATRELERVKEVEDRVRKECSAQLATAASERERLEEEMASLKAETENAVRAAEDSEKIATERARALIQLEERLEEEEAGRRKAHKRAEELHRDLIKVRAELQEERTKLVATESALQADRARVLELTAGGERAAKEVQRLKDALTRAEQAAVREREELTRTLRAEADHALGQIKSEQETAALDGRIRAENAAAAVEAMRRDMREVADLVRNKTLGPALERAVRGLEERTNQLEGALRLLGSNSGPAFAAAASAPSVLALPATPLTFTHAHAQPHDISLSTPGFGPAANAINRAHAQDSVALLERLLQESRRESADLRDQMASTFRDLDRAKSHLASLEGKVTAAQAAADKADAEHEESSKRCKALAAELESALQDASILRGKLHEEVERRTADRSAHEEHTCRLEAAFAERSESMRRQSEALAEDLRGEVERVRSQWKAEVGEIERRFQDRLALADQENRMLGSQVRTETEREVKNELLRVHQAAMMEAEALHGQLQGQINAFQIKFEKVRAVLGPYADMLDDELRLDPAAEASLRTVELRTRLDQEVERCRVLSDAKDEMAKELKKLKTRIERREEDFTIVLMNIREVLGLDTSSTTIEDGLLSADKARFTQSLNRMRTLLTQALEKRQMAAISEALDDMGGGASAEDPSPSVTVARRARKEREQALQAEVVQLRSKVQEREREFTVLQQQGEDLKGKSDKVDKELAAAREELAETKAKLLESERALAQAHEEVGRTAKLLESSKAEATRVQVDLKKHLEAVEGELAAAREEGRTTAASLNQAKLEMGKVQEAVAAVTRDLEAAQAEAQRARDEAQKAREDGQRASVAAEERVNRGRREAMMAAEAQYSEAVKPLRAEVRRLQDQVQELTRQYQGDLEAKDVECAELRRRLQDLSDEARLMGEKAHKLQMQLQEESENADKARGERASLAKEKELLENQVRYLESKTARAVKDAEVLKGRLKEREEKVVELTEVARTARKERREMTDASALGSPGGHIFIPGSPLRDSPSRFG